MVDQSNIEARRGRLVWTSKGLGLGGAEAILVDLASHLIALGWDLHVANLHEDRHHSANLASMGVSVAEFGVRPSVRSFASYLRQVQPDIVHVNNPTSIPLVAACRLLGSGFSLVYTEHNVWGSRRAETQAAHWLFSTLPDANIAVSDAVRRSGHRWRRNVSVIHHGPPLGRGRPAGDLIGDPLFVMIGGLRRNKDHLNALAALSIVREQYRNAHLHIYGDGVQKGAIQREIANARLDDHVTMHGRFPNARSVLGEGRIFLQSSVAEGLPIAIGEALAAGSPIVATAVGGTEEALLAPDGSLVAELCPPSDAVALAAAMLRTLERSADAASKRLALAALRVPERTASAYDHIYQRCLRG